MRGERRALSRISWEVASRGSHLVGGRISWEVSRRLTKDAPRRALAVWALYAEVSADRRGRGVAPGLLPCPVGRTRCDAAFGLRSCRAARRSLVACRVGSRYSVARPVAGRSARSRPLLGAARRFAFGLWRGGLCG